MHLNNTAVCGADSRAQKNHFPLSSKAPNAPFFDDVPSASIRVVQTKLSRALNRAFPGVIDWGRVARGCGECVCPWCAADGRKRPGRMWIHSDQGEGMAKCSTCRREEHFDRVTGLVWGRAWSRRTAWQAYFCRDGGAA